MPQPFGPPLFMPSTPAQLQQMVAQQAAEAAAAAAVAPAAAAPAEALPPQLRSDGVLKATSKDEWLAERAEIIAEARKYLDGKDERIDSLVKLLEDAGEEVAACKVELAASDDALRSKNVRISQLEDELASLTKALDAATTPVIEAKEDSPAGIEGAPGAPPAADAPVLALDGKPVDTTPPPPPGPDADGVPGDDA